MTNFLQTMKDWRRMCKYYSDESMKDRQHSCVDMCPLGHNTACGVIEDALDSDIEVMAKEIAKWAAEHPEPMYPTWWNYMRMIGVIPDELGDKTLGEVTVYSLMNTRIQSDIAEKLGIEKE